MKLKELVNLLKTAAEQGVSNALAESGLQDWLTKADAYRIYGRGNVDRWVSEGLISSHPCEGGTSRKCLDRKELETVAASSNRITYLPVAER